MTSPDANGAAPGENRTGGIVHDYCSPSGNWGHIGDHRRKAVLSSVLDMARDTMPNGNQQTMRVSATDNTDCTVYSATLTLDRRWGSSECSLFVLWNFGDRSKCRYDGSNPTIFVRAARSGR